MRAPLPEDEPGRLAALHDAQVLDTAPEEDFDDIALLASEICGTPMGLVSLVDTDRQWFKAKIGLDIDETTMVRVTPEATALIWDRPAAEGDGAPAAWTAARA